MSKIEKIQKQRELCNVILRGFLFGNAKFSNFELESVRKMKNSDKPLPAYLEGVLRKFADRI